MNPPRVLFLLLLIFSCQTKKTDWQTHDLGPFTLNTPKGWRIVRQNGIDSYVGGLTNGIDSIWFDYGWYSVDLLDADKYQHLYAEDTVNGLYADLMKPAIAAKGYSAIYIPKVEGKNTFTMWALNVKDTRSIWMIYKSIRFQNSDTTKNPPLTLAKFLTKSTNLQGKEVFQQNCASCHHMFKKLTGPPLVVSLNQRTNEWLFTFLARRKAMYKDSTSQKLVKEYQFECPEFQQLSKEQVAILGDYVRRYGADY